MKMKTMYLTTFIIVLLTVTFWGTAQENGKKPVTVSPGSETEMVTVWQSCPTFSWSSVDQAASYRIAVFESVDGKITPYEGMTAISSPVISKQIPGPALSWTISSEESLKSGSMYTWYVQAVDAAGNAIGPWSNGRIFQVEQEVRFAGIEEKLGEILKSYGVNDETAANVLKDMKSEVKEVVVRGGGAGTKNSPEVGGIQGGVETTTKTLLGLYAGYSNTTGVNNTFIGYSAGRYNNTGYGNTFLGHDAGYDNTAGSNNTFLGDYAGSSNTTASYNTFIGCNAGYLNTTGIHNIFLGHYAGASNTTASENTFIGTNAGRSNTTGFYNSFIGYNAGYANTTGSNNTFLGIHAGYANTIGYDNTFLGNSAGAANTTGFYNTFLGYYAGRNNTTGVYNAFLGSYAGYLNTTGSSNAFFGYKSGYANTSGIRNVFLGVNAGCYNTTGIRNSFIGNYAGYYTSTGSSNTFLGNDAGLSNNIGSNNTFLGRAAGYSNTIGLGNVFIGYSAGYFETGSNRLYIANSDTISPLIFGEFNNNIVKVNGKLGISITTSPMHLIDVGNVGAYCDGGVWVNGSSRQFKNNIRNITADEASEALNGLNPVKFYYKENETEEFLGFIAEDVPDLVATNDRKGLSPMDITAVLTKVVQELQRENLEQQNVIREQQEVNREYKKLISDLQERVATLEKK